MGGRGDSGSRNQSKSSMQIAEEMGRRSRERLSENVSEKNWSVGSGRYGMMELTLGDQKYRARWDSKRQGFILEVRQIDKAGWHTPGGRDYKNPVELGDNKKQALKRAINYLKTGDASWETLRKEER